MRSRYMIGAVVAGGALLAACGSTSTQSVNSTPAPTAKKSATTTSATTSEYLNIYKGIPNSPVSSNGYPFSVPDSMRILAPKVLSKEVLDTKLAKIGDTYVGTTWTPAQRMEIYTAKMFMLYGTVFGLPQYLTTTGTYGTTNKLILSDIAQVSAPLYGSLAAADKQMGATPVNDGLSFFSGEAVGQIQTGVNTAVKPFLNAGNISFKTHAGDSWIFFTVPKGAYSISIKTGNSSDGTIGGTVTTVAEVGIQPKPNEWSHLWPVIGSGITN